ncbi:MAG TPA: hypothetical protein VF282_00960 [Bacillota bacterium]
MLVLLRVLLYVQFLLGAGRVFGLIGNPYLWELHIGAGTLAALLALVLLRPLDAPVNPGLRAAARFMPLLALALGLARYLDILTDPGTYWLHVAVGLASVGLVEAAAGQQRRAQRAGR